MIDKTIQSCVQKIPLLSFVLLSLLTLTFDSIKNKVLCWMQVSLLIKYFKIFALSVVGVNW